MGVEDFLGEGEFSGGAEDCTDVFEAAEDLLVGRDCGASAGCYGGGRGVCVGCVAARTGMLELQRKRGDALCARSREHGWKGVQCHSMRVSVSTRSFEIEKLMQCESCSRLVSTSKLNNFPSGIA